MASNIDVFEMMMKLEARVQKLTQNDIEKSKEIELLKQKDVQESEMMKMLETEVVEKSRRMDEMRREIDELKKKELINNQEVLQLKEENKEVKKQLNIGRQETSACASAVDIRSANKKTPSVVVPRRMEYNIEHVSNPNNVTITNGNVFEFKGWSTVAAPSAVVKRGAKVYYEVTFDGKAEGVSYIGWMTNNFKRNNKDGHGVGGCIYSWGFCAQVGRKGHNNKWAQWGAKLTEDGGEQVLGVSLDMEKGIISYSLNGSWISPMGNAFHGINTNLHIFPAISGSAGIKLSVNFGDKPLRFPRTDHSYKKIVEL